MRYEWDPQKDELNRRKHGLRLHDALPVFTDLHALEFEDDRFDYGESRAVTVGLSQGRLLAVVHTFRDPDLIRIISVRKASRHEQNAHHDLAGR